MNELSSRGHIVVCCLLMCLRGAAERLCSSQVHRPEMLPGHAACWVSATTPLTVQVQGIPSTRCRGCSPALRLHRPFQLPAIGRLGSKRAILLFLLYYVCPCRTSMACSTHPRAAVLAAPLLPLQPVQGCGWQSGVASGNAGCYKTCPAPGFSINAWCLEASPGPFRPTNGQEGQCAPCH